MWIKRYIDADNLQDNLWGQGQRNYAEYKERGATDEQLYDLASEYLADWSENKVIDETSLNDFFAYESNLIEGELRLEGEE